MVLQKDDVTELDRAWEQRRNQAKLRQMETKALNQKAIFSWAHMKENRVAEFDGEEDKRQQSKLTYQKRQCNWWAQQRKIVKNS